MRAWKANSPTSVRTRKWISGANSALPSDGLDDLIKAGYKLLDLISFFTTGEDESRAWTIKRGDKAPDAGAAIHTDFRDKFIRAEVIHWDTLLECGSWAKAREKATRTLRRQGIRRPGRRCDGIQAQPGLPNDVLHATHLI